MGNKHYHKYSDYSKNNVKETVNEVVNEVVDEVVDEVVNEIVDEVTTNVAEALSTPEEETIQEGNTKLTGVVAGCNKLYVRKRPDVNSDHLCIINRDAVVEIDLENSTEYFYKVSTFSGVQGYCMKKFINFANLK